MQVAKLAQYYHGFLRQTVSPYAQGTGPQPAEPKRSRPVILPAERLVEGELLRDRQRRPGAPLDQLLQRGRFTGNTGFRSEDIGAQAAQRAINAYLDSAVSPPPGAAGRPQVVDYYA